MRRRWMRLLRYFGLAKPLPRGSRVRVVDMTEVITMLTPDVSQFQTMLALTRRNVSWSFSTADLWSDWLWVEVWKDRVWYAG